MYQAASKGFIKTNTQHLCIKNKGIYRDLNLSMAKHHDYKADEHSLYNRPYRELICYWVVQYDREPWARQHDYLASLTIIVEEEVPCLQKPLPWPMRQGASKETHWCKDYCYHNMVQRHPDSDLSRVVLHSSPACWTKSAHTQSSKSESLWPY